MFVIGLKGLGKILSIEKRVGILLKLSELDSTSFIVTVPSL